VKITDFGIAYAAWSAPITQAGALVGTPAYLAPERIAGGPATPASDLYALGVVGYQCLTGEAPFVGIPPQAAAGYQHRTLPPLPRTVPAGVAGLVTELTARDPAARPASAGEVAIRAGQLRDALAGGPAAPRASEPRASEPRATATGAEPATLAGEPLILAGDPATLTGVPAAVAAPDHRPLLWDRIRPRRGVALAVAGVAVAAGLAGWLLAGAFGAGSPPPPAGAAGTSSGPSVRTVEVNAGALAGQQASEVSQRLRQLGLRPRVIGAVRGGQAPGTVIAVQPSGQVPAGSTVTVTAAVQPPGHGNGHGDGQGNGGD
jgi:serine/threonine-protein kinase